MHLAYNFTSQCGTQCCGAWLSASRVQAHLDTDKINRSLHTSDSLSCISITACDFIHGRTWNIYIWTGNHHKPLVHLQIQKVLKITHNYYVDGFDDNKPALLFDKLHKRVIHIMLYFFWNYYAPIPTNKEEDITKSNQNKLTIMLHFKIKAVWWWSWYILKRRKKLTILKFLIKTKQNEMKWNTIYSNFKKMWYEIIIQNLYNTHVL